MKGLSSGILANTTNLAQPNPSRSAVSQGGLLDRLSHKGDGIHVDPGPGRSDIDRRANPRRRGKDLGNRLDQVPVSLGEAFLDQGRIPSEEIDPHFRRRLIEGAGNLQVLFRPQTFGHRRDGGHG